MTFSLHQNVQAGYGRTQSHFQWVPALFAAGKADGPCQGQEWVAVYLLPWCAFMAWKTTLHYIYIYIYIYDPGIEPRRGRDFPHPSRPALGPSQPPINGYRIFSGGKRQVRGVGHPPPPSAEVKERTELYLYSPTGPSWLVLRWTLPLHIYSLHSFEEHLNLDIPSASLVADELVGEWMYDSLRDFGLSQRCCWGFRSFGMWHCVPVLDCLTDFSRRH